MKSRFLVKRAAAMLLAAGFLFVLQGDRGMTATPLGIDPLEVLNSRSSPTSSSCRHRADERTTVKTTWRRPPRLEARLRQARHAPGPREQREQGQHDVRHLHQLGEPVLQDDGRRQQQQPGPLQLLDGQGPVPVHGRDRPNIEPSPTRSTLPDHRERRAPNARTNNNQVVSSKPPPPTPSALPIPPRFYQSGADLATAMAAAMNAASCTGSARANTYAVTYGVAGGGLFQFSSAGARTFTMDWTTATNSIRGVLNRVGAGTPGAGPGPSTEDAHRTCRLGDSFAEGRRPRPTMR
jgi:hypothetical protein